MEKKVTLEMSAEEYETLRKAFDLATGASAAIDEACGAVDQLWKLFMTANWHEMCRKESAIPEFMTSKEWYGEPLRAMRDAAGALKAAKAELSAAAEAFKGKGGGEGTPKEGS